jgi:hypothetical protein
MSRMCYPLRQPNRTSDASVRSAAQKGIVRGLRPVKYAKQAVSIGSTGRRYDEDRDMDVYTTLRELRTEKRQIERTIDRLETRLQAMLPRNPNNRGRRSMPRDERTEVSRRMTAYWARRRARDRAQPHERSLTSA